MVKKVSNKQKKINKKARMINKRIKKLREDQHTFYLFANAKGNNLRYWMKEVSRLKTEIAKLETDLVFIEEDI